MEKKKNNWNEISEDLNKLGKKIKEQTFEDNSMEDLKDSFNSTVNETAVIFKELINNIETKIKDEELKKETKEIINKLNSELTDSIKNLIDGDYLLLKEDLENPEEE
tara:strand:- start:34 stop:354 length:321 start_codon:yes stop_codon:yes gene_type:complete